MAADSPNDKRYMLLAFLRPTPICIAVCGAMGGPMPTAVAVFMDRETKSIRLDGPGIQAVRAVLASYSELLEVLPARTMYRCHRLTEKRIHAILDGRTKPHDVEIV